METTTKTYDILLKRAAQKIEFLLKIGVVPSQLLTLHQEIVEYMTIIRSGDENALRIFLHRIESTDWQIKGSALVE